MTIIAPSENEPVYVSRKGYHAINVQGIMNAELLFTNFVARWPGSTHDSFILVNSAVYTNFETGKYPDGWLLGDRGYSCKPWLLIPKLNPQTRAERAYNKSHIKTRNVIERGFGVWKMRFRCLHKNPPGTFHFPLEGVRTSSSQRPVSTTSACDGV